MFPKIVLPLKTLHIKNFKCFDDISLAFESKISILSGLRGSGKSTIFQALGFCINPFIGNQFEYQNTTIQKNKESPSIITLTLNSLNERGQITSKAGKELQKIIVNHNEAKIVVYIDIKRKNTFQYLLNNVKLSGSLLSEWINLLQGNFSRSTSFPRSDFKFQNLFSQYLTPQLKYQILIKDLLFSDTIEQYFILEDIIQGYETDSNKLEPVIEQAKLREESLKEEVLQLNEYTKLNEKLRLLEHEVLWSPIIQTEDRIQALKTTIETNTREVENLEKEMEEKEALREKLVSEINQLESARKTIDQEFNLIRNDYLEKKSRTDKLNKQQSNYEKAITRFKFDERQKQMKISDTQRIINELTQKKDKSSGATQKENQLLDELSHLEIEMKELDEKRQAYEKEQSTRTINKKKIEKDINSISKIMQNKRDEISTIETKSEKLIRQNDVLYAEIDSIKEKIAQLNEKMAENEKEIEKNKKDLRKSRKEIEKTSISRPDKVRAKNTVDTLIYNLKRQINDLESVGINDKAENELEYHQKKLKSLNKEFNEMVDSIKEKNQQLISWRQNWNKILTDFIHDITTFFNNFTESFLFSIKVDLHFPDSPSEGYLDMKFFLKSNELSIDSLSTTERTICNFIWYLSIANKLDYYFFGADEVLQQLHIEDRKNILNILNEKISNGFISANLQILLTSIFGSTESLPNDNYSLIPLNG